MWRRAFARIHRHTIHDPSTCEQLSNAHESVEKKYRRYREIVSHINTERFSAFMIKLPEQAQVARSTIEREEEKGGEGRIRRCGAIYTCQSRMFLRIGEVRSSIVAHVSCPIVPSIAATHEIALCMHTHTHTHDTNARCAAPDLPAARSRRVLYREGPSGDRFSLSASVATRTSAKRRIMLE